MPRSDGTGPNGEGPLTGRGFGDCDSNGDKKTVKRNDGLGAGRGTGTGAGRGRGSRRSMR